MFADLAWENRGRAFYRDSEKRAHCSWFLVLQSGYLQERTHYLLVL